MYLHEQKNTIGKEAGCLPATLMLTPPKLITNSYQLQWNRIGHLNYKELGALKEKYKIQLLKFVLATLTQVAKHGLSTPILHNCHVFII